MAEDCRLVWSACYRRMAKFPRRIETLSLPTLYDISYGTPRNSNPEGLSTISRLSDARQQSPSQNTCSCLDSALARLPCVHRVLSFSL